MRAISPRCSGRRSPTPTCRCATGRPSCSGRMRQGRSGSSRICGLFLSSRVPSVRAHPSGAAVECAPMRLVELQTEADSRLVCAAAGREVLDANLRGWAALIPEGVLAEGFRQSGLAVLQGRRGALALGASRRSGSLPAASPTRSSASPCGKPRASSCAERPPSSRRQGERVEAPAQLAAGGKDAGDGHRQCHARLVLRRRRVRSGRARAPAGRGRCGHPGCGGESTRPDAEPVEAKEERRRTEGVVRELSRRTGCPSASTPPRLPWRRPRSMRGEIVNDVSGGSAIRRCSAPQRAALCLMHMRGTPQEMQSRAVYSDLHGEVERELMAALERARAAGVPEERIALDPGLGFAKTGAHNLTLLRRLRELTQLGRPLVVGASRKSFIGKATGKPAPTGSWECGRCRARRVLWSSRRPRPRRGSDARGPRPRRCGPYVRCLTVRRKLAALPTRHQHCVSLRSIHMALRLAAKPVEPPAGCSEPTGSVALRTSIR